MRATFRYDMRADFGAEVSGHCFVLRCVPRDDLRQVIYWKGLRISPESDSAYSLDPHGNIVVEGTVRGSRDYFSVELTGEAELACSDGRLPEAEEGDWEREWYLGQTKLTDPGERVRGLAAKVSGGTVHEVAESAMAAVMGALPYTKGVTDSSTTVEQALGIGGGVCQDLAQALISVLRELDVPARYVAGLSAGEGETHAWAEYLDDGLWYGIDPTAGRHVSGAYLKLSHGRDAAECRINRGVFTGVSPGTQAVSAKLHVQGCDGVQHQEQRPNDRDRSRGGTPGWGGPQDRQEPHPA